MKIIDLKLLGLNHAYAYSDDMVRSQKEEKLFAMFNILFSFLKTNIYRQTIPPPAASLFIKKWIIE